jgi:hypothetical protein
MIASRSGKRPHLVKCGKGGRISCDVECANWKSIGICSHCVAVAHTNNILQHYLDFFRKTKLKRPNITQLPTADMPTGVGKKGNRVVRKKKQSQIETVVPAQDQEPPTSSSEKQQTTAAFIVVTSVASYQSPHCLSSMTSSVTPVIQSVPSQITPPTYFPYPHYGLPSYHSYGPPHPGPPPPTSPSSGSYCQPFKLTPFTICLEWAILVSVRDASKDLTKPPGHHLTYV